MRYESFEAGAPEGENDHEEPIPMIVISDPGQDLDDEMSFIMLRYLEEQGMVELRGVIATLTPAFDRARLCRGCLDLLGLKSVPIGVGTDGGDLKGQHRASTFEGSAASYMPEVHSESASYLEPGSRLLFRLYDEAASDSIRLVIIASLKDPALFLRDNEAIFAEKTREVIIMGGVEPWSDTPGGDGSAGTYLVPDSAHNNMFDAKASKFFYRRCQELGVPIIVVSRHAAYPAKMPRSVYDDLALLGSSIGWRLRNAQRTSIEALWVRASSEGEERLGLPPRCDRSWFLKTFCGGQDGDPPRTKKDSIWDLIKGFNQYDTLAVIVAVPQLRRRFFDPVEVPMPVVDHSKPWPITNNLVIGKSAEEHNIRNPEELLAWLTTGFKQGLSLDHHHKSQVIILMQVRWDNMPDLMLTCVMLRALYNLGVMDCIGVLISPCPDTVSSTSAKEASPAGKRFRRASFSAPISPMLDAPKESFTEAQVLESQAKEIKTMLVALGLGHVPVLAGGNGDPENTGPKDATTDGHLEELYAKAPRIGVTVIVTASLTQLYDFASRHSSTFRDKTQAVVVMGGATVTTKVAPVFKSDAGEGGAFLRNTKSESSDVTGMEPDPEALNHRLDLPAAQGFFEVAQRNGVPIVVLSRHLSHACRVPRELFDTLGKHGGAMGAQLVAMERDRVAKLWRLSGLPADDPERCGLPARCDREWFVRSFCPAGAPENDDDVWSKIESFNVYNPLALLVSLPFVVDRFMNAHFAKVRSATHKILGLSEELPGVEDANAIRELIYQCLFKGARINMSDYELDLPPPIPLSVPDAGHQDDSEHPMWVFDCSEEALTWLRPSAVVSCPSKAEVKSRQRRRRRLQTQTAQSEDTTDPPMHCCCRR